MKEGTREGGRAFRLHYSTSVQGGGEEVGTESVVLQCNPRKDVPAHWEVLEPASSIRGVLGVIELSLEWYPHCAQSLAGSSLRDVWS